MWHLRSRIAPVLAALALLLPTAAAQAEDLQIFLSGQITYQEAVEGGTLYYADVVGEGTPVGPVGGLTGFVIRGPSIEDGFTVLVDANGDELYLTGAGSFVDSTHFEGYGEVVGGTGAYAKATGSVYFLGEDLGSGQFSVAYFGEINR